MQNPLSCYDNLRRLRAMLPSTPVGMQPGGGGHSICSRQVEVGATIGQAVFMFKRSPSTQRHQKYTFTLHTLSLSLYICISIYIYIQCLSQYYFQSEKGHACRHAI